MNLKLDQYTDYLQHNVLHTTMCKNNSQFSSLLKGCSPRQLFCKLTVKYHAVGYIFLH